MGPTDPPQFNTAPPPSPRCQRAHPQIALHFVPYVQGYDFHRADLDCSILFGDGRWPVVKAHYLTGREQVLIAPPSPTHQPLLRQPQDVARFQRLQHVSVPMAWSHWMASHGLEGINPFAGPQMHQFHGIIRAVAAALPGAGRHRHRADVCPAARHPP